MMGSIGSSMKKRIALLGIFLIFLCMLGFLISESKRKTQFVVDNGGNFYVSVKADESTQKIMPWYDETQGVYYFFLPSCVNDETVYFNSSRHSIEIDGNKIHKRAKWVWEKDRIYSLGIDGDFMRITFMKSENLPAFFIYTSSGNMDSVWADKEYEETGSLTIIEKDGHIEYTGNLNKISGRGNMTWQAAKKPYAISLKDSYPLCDLSSAKNWKLLALYYEYDKMHSKIILDMARKIGFTGTPECTWVDLYCCGEYQGLYLLTGDVSEKYKNTSGILFEKAVDFQLKYGEPFFETDRGHCLFKYDNPEKLSPEEMKETENFVQKTETALLSGDDTYKEYIDIDSFAKQYLLDKIFMDPDAMWASTFYYLDQQENKIYVGPFWDYDLSCGSVLPNYNTSIEGKPNTMEMWYDTLYQDADFYTSMQDTYLELLPEFENILYQEIDQYAEWIQASEAMDEVLYEQVFIYDEWDSRIKCLKYFLAHRLNYLNDLWGIEGHFFQSPESTGEYHTIYFKSLDGITMEERTVLDGSCLSELPALDKEKYIGWYYWDQNAGKFIGYEYSTMRPVYEDVYCCARIVEQE